MSLLGTILRMAGQGGVAALPSLLSLIPQGNPLPAGADISQAMRTLYPPLGAGHGPVVPHGGFSASDPTSDAELANWSAGGALIPGLISKANSNIVSKSMTGAPTTAPVARPAHTPHTAAPPATDAAVTPAAPSFTPEQIQADQAERDLAAPPPEVPGLQQVSSVPMGGPWKPSGEDLARMALAIGGSLRDAGNVGLGVDSDYAGKAMQEIQAQQAYQRQLAAMSAYAELHKGDPNIGLLMAMDPGEAVKALIKGYEPHDTAKGAITRYGDGSIVANPEVYQNGNVLEGINPVTGKPFNYAGPESNAEHTTRIYDAGVLGNEGRKTQVDAFNADTNRRKAYLDYHSAMAKVGVDANNFDNALGALINKRANGGQWTADEQAAYDAAMKYHASDPLHQVEAQILGGALNNGGGGGQGGGTQTGGARDVPPAYANDADGTQYHDPATGGVLIKHGNKLVPK